MSLRFFVSDGHDFLLLGRQDFVDALDHPVVHLLEVALGVFFEVLAQSVLDAGKSMILAKKMITKLTKALDCDGYNIVQNNGEAAGQTVFHYHVHMIPRHKDDKVGLGWTMHELTEEEKEDVLSKI